MTDTLAAPEGLVIKGPMGPGFDTVLTPDALAFLAKLHRAFNGRRLDALAARQARQADLDGGAQPRFGDPNGPARAGEWRVTPAPADLQDRRVEITGPVDRKMIINALNSGAKCFMADFEDASSPSWSNMIEGQINLRDAIRRSIDFTDPTSGKAYALNDQVATLIVRPRGWHLNEAHLEIDGEPMAGGLFDFGLYLFHNHQALKDIQSGPYFYLPKLENAREAALWSDALSLAEDTLGLARGTCRCTVLIETILATFELDEILYALKDHITALNCGRWDYIFSYIKRFRTRSDMTLPDRAQVTMSVPFMDAYVRLVIDTCHKRGAHAMGGMSAFIPVKADEAANATAYEKLHADKLREVTKGHDGTWVAHPAMVAAAKAVFDEHMPGPNQLDKRPDALPSEAELLARPDGAVTDAGVRNNMSVGIQYVAAWFQGRGAVPIFNLMEDAATAEIARAQLWQWRKNGVATAEGQAIDDAFLTRVMDEELAKIKDAVGADAFASGRFEEAAELMRGLIFQDAFEEFLTLPAYERVKSA